MNARRILPSAIAVWVTSNSTCCASSNGQQVQYENNLSSDGITGSLSYPPVPTTH